MPHEALLRPQFTSRPIEGWLWNLKLWSFGENLWPKLSELPKELTGTQNKCVTSFWHCPHIYSTISQVFCYLIIFWYKFTLNFLLYHFCVICPIHFITTFGNLYESWNSSLSNFPASSLTYIIISPNFTVLSYILNVIILKTFSTTLYTLYRFFVDDDLKGL